MSSKAVIAAIRTTAGIGGPARMPESGVSRPSVKSSTNRSIESVAASPLMNWMSGLPRPGTAVDL